MEQSLDREWAENDSLRIGDGDGAVNDQRKNEKLRFATFAPRAQSSGRDLDQAAGTR